MNREPEIGRIAGYQPDELFGFDAHHGYQSLSEDYPLPDDDTVAAEVSSPIPVAEDTDGRGGPAVIGVGEETAGGGRDAEDLEVEALDLQMLSCD